MLANNSTFITSFRKPHCLSSHHDHMKAHHYLLHPSKTHHKHIRPNSTTSTTDTAVLVSFAPSFGDVSIYAQPGEILCDIAERCGVYIPVGCCTGNCGVCEVEIRKYLDTSSSVDGSSHPSSQGASIVVKSCITPIPSRKVATRIEVEELTDVIWGLDGYDT